MIKNVLVDNDGWWYLMVEEEVAFVKVQPRKAGSFMVTIPVEAVRRLEIKREDRLKVLVDKEKRRIIYQL